MHITSEIAQTQDIIRQARAADRRVSIPPLIFRDGAICGYFGALAMAAIGEVVCTTRPGGNAITMRFQPSFVLHDDDGNDQTYFLFSPARPINVAANIAKQIGTVIEPGTFVFPYGEAQPAQPRQKRVKQPVWLGQSGDRISTAPAGANSISVMLDAAGHKRIVGVWYHQPSCRGNRVKQSWDRRLSGRGMVRCQCAGRGPTAAGSLANLSGQSSRYRESQRILPPPWSRSSGSLWPRGLRRPTPSPNH